MSKISRRAARIWDAWPIFSDLERRAYDRDFATDGAAGWFRGIYATAAAAAGSAPPNQPLGYDNPAAARMYTDRLTTLYPSDYAAMFWLDRLFQLGARSVFDVGGHIGVAFYGFQTLMRFPADVSWLVCDVPAVVARGCARIKEVGGVQPLAYTADIAEGAGRDILFASGALQYLGPSLAELISAYPLKPRYILVNHLPVHHSETYFTLQNIGTAYCPYRISSNEDALKGMADLGYTMLDSWMNAEKSCFVPFAPEHSLDNYYGFVLGLDTSAQESATKLPMRLIRGNRALDGGNAGR